MQRRFSPGAIDYNSSISANYDAGRALTPHTAEAWCTAIQPFIQPSQGARILDLGSGTGRFSSVLAHAFDAQVIGAEPSQGMLAVATQQQRPPGVVYLAAAAEHLPCRSRVFHVAWLSHVFHHIPNRPACARELKRVLCAGGRVLLRGTFGDRLDGFPTLFLFFPGARDICAELPTVSEAVAVFAAAGFACEARRRIEQRTCGSLAEFAARTRVRADSALAVLPDDEFRRGQAAVEDAARRERSPAPIVETVDLVVFRSCA